MFQTRNFFLLCFAFLLTPQSWAGDEAHFQKAQKFFYESQQKQKGNASVSLSKRDVAQAQNYESQSHQTSYKVKQNYESSSLPPAVYVSVLSQVLKNSETGTGRYSLGLGVSIPVYSDFRWTRAELQLAGDIRDAGEYGRIQGMHKESFSIVRLSDTLFEGFFGLGIGYGHGSLIESSERVYAPVMAGLQWGKIYRNDKIFYRFELGWIGNFYFSDSNSRQGILANLSIGYKL